MLNGPEQKFCEGVVTGLPGREAYLVAYPEAAPESASVSAARLGRHPDVVAEVARMRAVAETLAGSAVMTLVEKRAFLARVVRARPALLDEESDLWQSVKHTSTGVEFRLPDKLAAIARDNVLAGHGAEAGGGELEAEDALAALLERVRG